MTAATAAYGYRPGPWFAVLGHDVAVLLPDTDKARVGGLWELVDDGAGFDEVLDVLISGGLRQLPGFVLVGTGEPETTVVVRGEARVLLTTDDGEIEVSGTATSTWSERSLAGVTSFRVSVAAAEDDAPTRLVDSGLVRVSELRSPGAAADGPAPEAAPEPADSPAQELDDLAETGPMPALADDLAETGPMPGLADAAPPGPIGPEPDVPPTPPEPSFGHPSGPPPAIGEVSWAEDHDGLTIGGRRSLSASGTPDDPEPRVPDRAVATLVFSHGDRVDVDRVVLVGRAPEARGSTTDEEPRLVAVPSPAQEISSTHVEVRPGTGADQGTAVITDLGSTNGTMLVQPGLPPEELQPGVAVPLLPGAVVDLGDGVTIQVVNP